MQPGQARVSCVRSVQTQASWRLSRQDGGRWSPPAWVVSGKQSFGEGLAGDRQLLSVVSFLQREAPGSTADFEESQAYSLEKLETG